MKADRSGDLVGHMMARPALAFEVEPSVLPAELVPVHAAIVQLQSTTKDVTPRAIAELSGADVRWLSERAVGYHGSFAGCLEAVTERSKRRRMVEVGVALRAAGEGNEDADEAIAAAITALHAKHSDGLIPIGEARARRLDTVTRETFCVLIDGAEHVPLAESDFVVIGARPGVGKTVLALQNAVKWASAGIPTALFSFEMGSDQLFDRIAASRVPLTVGRMRRGVSEDYRDLIADNTADIADIPLYIDDAAPTFQAMTLSCRAFAARGGRVAIIDYFGLATGSVKWEQMAQASKDLKRLARQTGLVVITLSQLSRDVAKEGRRPTIADLRGTGSLEQDADTVAVMGKPDDALLDEWRSKGWILPEEGLSFIDFAKARHSMPACIPLKFIGNEMRFAPVDQIGERP